MHLALFTSTFFIYLLQVASMKLQKQPFRNTHTIDFYRNLWHRLVSICIFNMLKFSETVRLTCLRLWNSIYVQNLEVILAYRGLSPTSKVFPFSLRLKMPRVDTYIKLILNLP
mgnify:CR=1 FL=1